MGARGVPTGRTTPLLRDLRAPVRSPPAAPPPYCATYGRPWGPHRPHHPPTARLTGARAVPTGRTTPLLRDLWAPVGSPPAAPPPYCATYGRPCGPHRPHHPPTARLMGARGVPTGRTTPLLRDLRAPV